MLLAFTAFEPAACDVLVFWGGGVVCTPALNAFEALLLAWLQLHSTVPLFTLEQISIHDRHRTKNLELAVE